MHIWVPHWISLLGSRWLVHSLFGRLVPIIRGKLWWILGQMKEHSGWNKNRFLEIGRHVLGCGRDIQFHKTGNVNFAQKPRRRTVASQEGAMEGWIYVSHCKSWREGRDSLARAPGQSLAPATQLHLGAERVMGRWELHCRCELFPDFWLPFQCLLPSWHKKVPVMNPVGHFLGPIVWYCRVCFHLEKWKYVTFWYLNIVSQILADCFALLDFFLKKPHNLWNLLSQKIIHKIKICM